MTSPVATNRVDVSSRDHKPGPSASAGDDINVSSFKRSSSNPSIAHGELKVKQEEIFDDKEEVLMQNDVRYNQLFALAIFLHFNKKTFGLIEKKILRYKNS